MPFVVRRIEPKYVGRGHVPQDNVTSTTVGAELYATSNGTLASTLKQLASLLTVAEDIFGELTAELTNVANRSGDLRQRIDRLEDHLSTIDPKKIPVPESDICTFASRKNHYKASRVPTTGLFVSLTRPKVLQELYDSAAVVAVKSLDSLRRERDGRSSLDMYLCTPVLGKRRRDKSFDIESRVPAVMDDLRRWTSAEALGDVTVPPDCMSRIFQQDNTLDDAVDHKLPSPEEQNQAIALRFPAEIVAVDVSGKGFERMSMRRRSLMAGKNGDNQDTTVKRRSRPRRPRGKRRNTIAGTDRKEIRRAAGETSTVNETEGDITEEILNDVSPAHRSASTDILGKKELPNEKKWHDTLKAWGRSRLKLINSKTDDKIDKLSSNNVTIIDDNSYEMITATQRRKRDKIHERKPSFSSSSGKSIASSIAVSIPVPIRQPVKLRECAAQRRERRKGSNRDDPPHSSSGNWSASSESGRASIGSESTTATNPPRSTTTTSTGTCSLSLNHARRLRGRDTSTSSSVTSEGTLTPDIIQDISTIPFSDEGEGEGETCSVYSCDTEGYYTSFHMDSGLKTLREEEAAPSKPLTKSNEITPDSMSPIVENEYELFGRGSTSTTTSSAGTVCTTLLAPVPPERKSSLTVVAMVHGQNKNGGESPDSGHNTSSSPVESASSPACTARSCSELEYSESSDLEGCDRIERIRSKTAINTARIPSMCVITPPGSDDEQTNNNNNNNNNHNNNNNNNNIKTQQDINSNEIINCNKNNTGSILMSATVGTSKMQVINGDDKNLYATVQRVEPKSNNSINGQNNINNNSSNNNNIKTSPLSGVLGKLRGVLPLKKLHYGKNLQNEQINCHNDSGDYVTIADVRNNNDKHMPCNTNQVTYANALELHEQQQQQRQQQQQQPYDTEYVSLSELPKKFTDSSLERKRHGARVTLDSEGKVVYSSDSLKRRKGAHTTFNPGPFVKDSSTPSPTASPMFRRAQTQIRSVNTKQNEQPLVNKTNGKVVIRAAGMSPERDNEQLKQSRGAYVNVQNEEDNPVISKPPESSSCQVTPQSPPPYIAPPQPQDWQRYQHNEIHNSNKNNQENIGPNNNQQRINSVSKNFIQRPTFSSPYYTMPNRKTQSDIREQIRCVTPDITRDLNRQNDEKNINRSGQHVTTTIDSRNRFLAPLGLSALGYRFFASSPVNSSSPNNKTVVDGSSNPSISQISMDKSGPRSSSTVAQRLSAMSKNSWTISSSTGSLDYKENKPIHIESTNRNPPPMNILLSPIKSTMSNEELFAAIHKSKRKLNIKNETDRFASNNTINKSYEQIGTRHSWSPESKNTPEVPPAILMPSATARMDFKRLLLQQSSKSNPNRISAAEQLKLSRQQHQQQLQQQHHHQQQQQQCHLRNQQQLHQQPSLARAMSPRSIWRFQTPRSDVLSSTIVEDTAAEERAAKLSPENQIQNNRLRTRRQLDLSGISPIPKQQTIGQNINNDNERYEMNNRLSRVNNVDLNNDNDNRRIRNEKARANFLATGISTISEHGYRTRSESPRNPATCAKSVTRSPSAPTLETAL